MDNNIISIEHELYKKKPEVLVNAEKAAEEEMNSNPSLSIIESIDESKEDYLESLSPYGLSNDDTLKLYKAISEYKDTAKVSGLYSKLPKKIQELANGFAHAGGMRISKDDAAGILLDQFINDAKLNNTLESYTNDMNTTISNMSTEYDDIFTAATEEIFNRIGEFDTTDPEKAEKLREIKKAFEYSRDYLLLVNSVIEGDLPKKYIIKKHLNMYISRVYMFNKTMNEKEGVKFPDISEMIQIVHDVAARRDEHFSDDVLKIFAVIIIDEIMRLDLDGEKNVSNLAYAYKLINNIYTLKFIGNYSDSQNDIIDSIIKSLRGIETKIK